MGPAGSGRARLIGRKIVSQEVFFRPASTKSSTFLNIFSNVTEGSIVMDCQSKNVDNEVIQGIEWNFLQTAEAQKRRILLVSEDLIDEAPQNKVFLALVNAG